MISTILNILGSLGVFLFGMKVMSEGIQKTAGSRLRNILAYMTQNRFAGVLTGFLTTCLVQSSSATTVMVVSFVNAGLLTLIQSIGVIMGANIGTTITSLLASMVSGTIAPLAVALSHLSFNILGIGLLWPIKKVREIPIHLAEWFSNLATQNKIYPLLYILIVFFLIPLSLISLVR